MNIYVKVLTLLYYYYNLKKSEDDKVPMNPMFQTFEIDTSEWIKLLHGE